MSDVKIGTRKDAEIKNLYDEQSKLFDQALKMLDMSIVLLDDQTNELALTIIDEDTYMDEIHGDMIIYINNFILQEQPKAKDLRIALGIYSMCYDTERIADYFKNFAKVIIKTKITKKEQINILKSVLNELKKRLKELKVAYEKSSHDLAKSLARRDHEIDDLVRALNDELLNEVRKKLTDEEANDIRRVVLLSKSFERCGDHMVNICEQISFIEKGRIYHYS